MGCSKKNGISGGSSRRDQQGKPGQGTSEPSSRKAIEAQPRGDGKAKSEETTDAADGEGVPGGDKSVRSQTESGDAAKSRSSSESNNIPCADDSIPQERPKNNEPSRQYRSYSEECRARTPCVRKEDSNGYRPSSSGSLPAGRMGPGRGGNGGFQRLPEPQEPPYNDYPSRPGGQNGSQITDYNGRGSSPNQQRSQPSGWADPPPCPIPPSFENGPLYQDGRAQSRSADQRVRPPRNGNGNNGQYPPGSPRRPQSSGMAEGAPCPSPPPERPRSQPAYGGKPGNGSLAPCPTEPEESPKSYRLCESGQCLRRSKPRQSQ